MKQIGHLEGRYRCLTLAMEVHRMSLMTTNANTITLIRGKTGWSAIYEGPHATKIQKLFGSTTLPTVFTHEASSTLVLAEVAARNASCVVTVR